MDERWIADVAQFWFGQPDERWWKADSAFDEERVLQPRARNARAIASARVTQVSAEPAAIRIATASSA